MNKIAWSGIRFKDQITELRRSKWLRDRQAKRGRNESDGALNESLLPYAF